MTKIKNIKTTVYQWKGKTVPEVLLSGHHADIKTWRRKQAETITRDRRPDLWARYQK